jgi:hypothetical protein
MVNLDPLMNALPISTLEPADIAVVTGIFNAPEDQPWLDSIHFLEPPADRRVPYINPLQAIDTLLRGQKNAPETARSGAREAAARMRENEPDWDWVNFYDSFDKAMFGLFALISPIQI